MIIKKRLSHGQFANAAHPNGFAFLGSNKRICSTLTSFAFLRAKYCHVAVHQAKNNILILWNFVEIPNPCDNKKGITQDDSLTLLGLTPSLFFARYYW